MKFIRLLADVRECDFKKGEEHNVPDELAEELISQSLAEIVSRVSRAVDQDAQNALKSAREKDAPHE